MLTPLTPWQHSSSFLQSNFSHSCSLVLSFHFFQTTSLSSIYCSLDHLAPFPSKLSSFRFNSFSLLPYPFEDFSILTVSSRFLPFPFAYSFSLLFSNPSYSQPFLQFLSRFFSRRLSHFFTFAFS